MPSCSRSLVTERVTRAEPERFFGRAGGAGAIRLAMGASGAAKSKANLHSSCLSWARAA